MAGPRARRRGRKGAAEGDACYRCGASGHYARDCQASAPQVYPDPVYPTEPVYQQEQQCYPPAGYPACPGDDAAPGCTADSAVSPTMNVSYPALDSPAMPCPQMWPCLPLPPPHMQQQQQQQQQHEQCPMGVPPQPWCWDLPMQPYGMMVGPPPPPPPPPHCVESPMYYGSMAGSPQVMREAHSWESLDTMPAISEQMLSVASHESLEGSNPSWESWTDPPASTTTCERGHFVAAEGTLVGSGRYRVMGRLGKGTFATCVEAEDTQTGQSVAIKVVRVNSRALQDCDEEVRILKTLLSGAESSRVVRLADSFMVNEHKCLVTARHGASLMQLLEANPDGLELSQAITATKGVLDALAHIHSLSVIHCDIKPENVLCTNVGDDVAAGITLCDFGGAFLTTDSMPRLIQTRPYRAPEVLLCNPWCTPVDLWSVGCLTFELVTGKCLFENSANTEHIKSVVTTVGQRFPTQMVSKAPTNIRRPLFVTGTNRLKCTGKPTKRIDERLPSSVVGAPLEGLLRGLLRVDPLDRITAANAAAHPSLL